MAHQNMNRSRDSIFSDSSGHWLPFRKKRFAVAGDGEYAVLKGLDLSGLSLHNFVVGWLTFVDCKLDNTSFRNTDFAFRTAFVDCSLKGTDFTDSFGGDDLFYGCDLNGAIFNTSQPWASVGLDGKKVPSYFVNCNMGTELRDFLIHDGNVVIEGEAPADIKQRVNEVAKAPQIV